MAENPKRMLIVDDDELVLELLQFEMEDLGFDVTIAHDGPDGIAKFSKGKFDIVLTDFKMPEMDGLTMVEGILGLDESVPIIMLSGFFDSAIEERAQKLGVKAVLEKPPEAGRVFSLLSELGFV